MRSKQEVIKVWLLDEILRGKIVTPERVLSGTKVKAVDLGIQGQSSGLLTGVFGYISRTKFL